MTPSELEALLQQNGSNPQASSTANPLNGSADENSGNPSNQQPSTTSERRTALLQPILTTCKQTLHSNPSELALLAEKLADGSKDVAWRLPLGESGILDFFLRLLARDDLSEGTYLHALRLVGNACADTQVNRDRVVAQDQICAISRHFQNPALLPYAVPVLYNVMLDHEPAQKLASRSRLSSQLLPYISASNLSTSKGPALILYACKILILVAEQDGELDSADPSTASRLVALAASELAKEDFDIFASLLEAALVYLPSEAVQICLMEENHFDSFLDAFHCLHIEIQLQDVEDEYEVERVKQLRIALLNPLADLSGHDSFPARYPLSSTMAQQMLAWLRTSTVALQTAACIVLGNLSRSNDASTELIDRHIVHTTLTKILSDPAVSDWQLLRLALSFCRNLAILPENKAKLGALLSPSCIPRLLVLDTLPNVQFAAVSLARLLLANCPPNVSLACAPPNADAAHSEGVSIYESTTAAALISLFDRADAEPTRLEAARSIAALCRVIYSPVAKGADLLPGWDDQDVRRSPAETASGDAHEAEVLRAVNRRRRFYEKHGLAGPLAFLAALKQWPTLRSEAWFVLALMSRSVDGAVVVCAVLDDDAANRALVDAVRGSKDGVSHEDDDVATKGDVDTSLNEVVSAAKNSQQQQQQQQQQNANTVKADRENALVLCAELLRNAQDGLTPSRRTFLQDLLGEGTAQIAADRLVE